MDAQAETAAKLAGDMAFEHGCKDGVKQIWRVLYWRCYGSKGLRCSDFYASEQEALDRVARINEQPDMWFISLSKYTLVSRRTRSLKPADP